MPPKREKRGNKWKSKKNNKSSIGYAPNHSKLKAQSKIIQNIKKPLYNHHNYVSNKQSKRLTSLEAKTKILTIETIEFKTETNYINAELSSSDDNTNDEEYIPAEVLIILFELLQWTPYRKLEHSINLCHQLSAKFKCPSISKLNKLCQTKKELLNKIYY
eukprot:182146_1